jgi:hypothetical protein
LGSYESFLAKLDMVQREMGRSPAEFVPVKYQNHSEEGAGTFQVAPKEELAQRKILKVVR